MNDFLQSLRNGTLKRQDRPRKQYDNHQQHRNADRGGNRDKRNGPMRKSYPSHDLGELKKQLQTLNDNMELSRIAQERTAEAMERIARSLQALAPGRPDRHAPPPAEDSVPASKTPVEAPATPRKAMEGHSESPTDGDDRPAAAAIIGSLRKDGLSFEAIAEQLNEQAIPTLSGRGKWRAQNVSRAFNAASTTP